MPCHAMLDSIACYPSPSPPPPPPPHVYTPHTTPHGDQSWCAPVCLLSCVWHADVRKQYGKDVDVATCVNERMEAYYKAQHIVDPAQWEQFLKTLRTSLPLCVRVSGFRAGYEQVRDRLHRNVAGGGVAWFPGSLAWKCSNEAYHDPANAAFKEWIQAENGVGGLTFQEEVSLIPPLVLGIQPHHAVLDLCAAPGSKTSEALELMHQHDSWVSPDARPRVCPLWHGPRRLSPRQHRVPRATCLAGFPARLCGTLGPGGLGRGLVRTNERTSVGEGADRCPRPRGLVPCARTTQGATPSFASGLLVAHDMDSKRVNNILVGRLRKMHTSCIVVTIGNGARFPLLRCPSGEPFRFDRVMLDAPCSGALRLPGP